MNICPNCGKEVDDNARHCGHCGHKLHFDQKKTMLGMAAIDPQELQKRIAAARHTSNEAESTPETPTPEPGAGPAPEMAPTEVMEPVQLPTDDDLSAQASLAEALGGQESSEGMSSEAAPSPEESNDQAESDFATGPTQAMPALSRPTPAVDGTGERADVEEGLPHQPTGPMEALPTGAPSDEPGEWDVRDLADPLAPTELEMSPVDLSKTGPTAESTAQDPDERPHTAPQAGVEDAPAASHDAPSLTPTPAQGLASQLPDSLARLTEDPENKKRLMLFVGAVVVVLLGCCILSAVLSFMF